MAVTAYYHVGWWSIIGYAIAAVIAVADLPWHSATCRDNQAHHGRMNAGPQTQVDEIAPDIFRMSTWVPDITEHGFTFNQFLLTGDEPLLFHCGHRQLFPFVSAAINRVVPLEKLRWISFGHVEADECGAVNLLLHAAPNAEVIHGALACMVSLIDLCDRPPVVAPEDGVHDIGGHRLRFIPTPHVPHKRGPGCGSTRRRRPCSPVTC